MGLRANSTGLVFMCRCDNFKRSCSTLTTTKWQVQMSGNSLRIRPVCRGSCGDLWIGRGLPGGLWYAPATCTASSSSSRTIFRRMFGHAGRRLRQVHSPWGQDQCCELQWLHQLPRQRHCASLWWMVTIRGWSGRFPKLVQGQICATCANTANTSQSTSAPVSWRLQ